MALHCEAIYLFDCKFKSNVKNILKLILIAKNTQEQITNENKKKTQKNAINYKGRVQKKRKTEQHYIVKQTVFFPLLSRAVMRHMA